VEKVFSYHLEKKKGGGDRRWETKQEIYEFKPILADTKN